MLERKAWCFLALAACGTSSSLAGAPAGSISGADAGVSADASTDARVDLPDAPDAPIDAAIPGGPAVLLPGGAPGIGFDDMRFSRVLARLLIPAGRTGDLDEIDPATRAVTVIGGFSAASTYDGMHDVGVSSADEGGGYVFAVDRGTSTVLAIDPASRTVVASASVASAPDYVRYVAATREVWVTEPAAQAIEVFALSSAGAPSLARVAAIPVKGGPESLVVDGARGRAYTNTFASSTVAVDVAARAVVATWSSACAASRGLALDGARGVLFVACAEGAITSLDAVTGAVLATAKTGAGVDVIDYAPELHHLYVPASDDATMAILGVPAKTELAPLGTIATARGAHCVVADGIGQAWVCDPARGQLLVFPDPYPLSDEPSADAGAVDASARDAAMDATSCTPACAGSGTDACGSDGCGGSCGVCSGGAPCIDGRCSAATCTQACGADKCGWDPYQKGGEGAFACIPQSWTTDGCNGIGGIGTCDFSGALRRCTSAGLAEDQCASGCGLHASAGCGGLLSCITCNALATYCAGADTAPICQEGLRIECYDDSYTLEWCADSGKTCQCSANGCQCQ